MTYEECSSSETDCRTSSSNETPMHPMTCGEQTRSGSVTGSQEHSSSPRSSSTSSSRVQLEDDRQCNQMHKIKNCWDTRGLHTGPAQFLVKKRFGDEQTSQLSPRSAAGRPPKAKRFVKPVVCPETKMITAENQPAEGSPGKKLQKLARFRRREMVLDMELDLLVPSAI